MKSSKNVTIGAALIALSVSIAACSDDEKGVTADCVQRQPDGSTKVVSDSKCSSGGGSSSGFVWLYGGSYSNGRVTGGSYTKPAGTNITSRGGAPIVRGGFGGTGHGAGS